MAAPSEPRRSDASRSMRRAERRRRVAWFAAVSLAALIAYIPSFTAAFQFDDNSYIVGNENAFGSVAALVYFARSRIIPIATLAVNYAINGEQPFGYHVVNFFIHLLTTLAVYALAL